MISDVFEIGPHPALHHAMKDIKISLESKQDVRFHSTSSRSKTALNAMLELAGSAYSLGYPVDLAAINLQKKTGQRKLNLCLIFQNILLTIFGRIGMNQGQATKCDIESTPLMIFSGQL